MAKNSRETVFETTFGQYTTDEVLGEGGAGRVFRVKDEEGNAFALKLLHGQGVTSDKRRRFKNEIGFLQNTRHDNVVRVPDHGVQSDGKERAPFYIMDMYDGSLRLLMEQRNGVPAADVLLLFSQILDGTEAAHLKGVVHRDLKPENVLYRSSNRRLAVADFGVARFSAEDLLTAVETKPTTRLANFLYAAPEQRVRGQEVNVPADIYALGLMLNEMFTGQVPHGTDYRKIGEAAAEFAWLDPIVESMLRQDPAKRPSSIDALKREIQFQNSAFVGRQKISQIDQTVVHVDELDDPIVARGMQLADGKYENGVLKLQLSRPVNQTWINAIRNMGNYSSVMGKGPESFNFTGTEARISARENEISDIVQHFKSWLPKATQVYAQMLHKEAQQRAAAERANLEKQRKDEEEKLRIQDTLKKLLDS